MKPTERKEAVTKLSRRPEVLMKRFGRKSSESKLFTFTSKEYLMPKSISSVKHLDDPIFKGIPNPNYESNLAYGWEKMFKGILSPYANMYKSGINEIVSSYQVELDKKQIEFEQKKKERDNKKTSDVKKKFKKSTRNSTIRGDSTIDSLEREISALKFFQNISEK